MEKKEPQVVVIGAGGGVCAAALRASESQILATPIVPEKPNNKEVEDWETQKRVDAIMADLCKGLPRRRYGMAKFKKQKKGKRNVR